MVYMCNIKKESKSRSKISWSFPMSHAECFGEVGKDVEGVQFLSDDFLYSAEKALSNWTINSNF